MAGTSSGRGRPKSMARTKRPGTLRITPFLRHQSGQPFGRTFTTSLNYGSNVRILAEPIGTRRMDNVTILDVRIEKAFRPSAGAVSRDSSMSSTCSMPTRNRTRAGRPGRSCGRSTSSRRASCGSARSVDLVTGQGRRSFFRRCGETRIAAKQRHFRCDQHSRQTLRLDAEHPLQRLERAVLVAQRGIDVGCAKRKVMMRDGQPFYLGAPAGPDLGVAQPRCVSGARFEQSDRFLRPAGKRQCPGVVRDWEIRDRWHACARRCRPLPRIGRR